MTEWLHEGIQRSAGLATDDPPLTFRDLWTAPLHPGVDPVFTVQERALGPAGTRLDVGSLAALALRHRDAEALGLFGGKGSFGNGAASRVPPIGAYFADDLAAVGLLVTGRYPVGLFDLIMGAMRWKTPGGMPRTSCSSSVDWNG